MLGWLGRCCDGSVVEREWIEESFNSRLLRDNAGIGGGDGEVRVCLYQWENCICLNVVL